MIKTIPFAMIAILLAMPFQAPGQTPTLVVNPVAIAAGDEFVTADLTEMFLTSLQNTNAFNVIDARGGDRAGADFDLGARCNYQEEQVEEEVLPSLKIVKTTRSRVKFVRIEIKVNDRSGQVFFADRYEEKGRTPALAPSLPQPSSAWLTGWPSTTASMGCHLDPKLWRASS